jgi:putative membrane protein insertion efficiency factor
MTTKAGVPAGGWASVHMAKPNFLEIRQWPRRAARAAVVTYRYILSPLIGPRCRHLPGCSEYAEEAFGRFGLWAGGWMTLARILRCQPWGTSGLDFVPRESPAAARWWLPWRYGTWRGTNAAPPEAGAP